MKTKKEVFEEDKEIVWQQYLKAIEKDPESKEACVREYNQLCQDPEGLHDIREVIDGSALREFKATNERMRSYLDGVDRKIEELDARSAKMQSDFAKAIITAAEQVEEISRENTEAGRSGGKGTSGDESEPQPEEENRLDALKAKFGYTHDEIKIVLHKILEPYVQKTCRQGERGGLEYFQDFYELAESPDRFYEYKNCVQTILDLEKADNGSGQYRERIRKKEEEAQAILYPNKHKEMQDKQEEAHGNSPTRKRGSGWLRLKQRFWNR